MTNPLIALFEENGAGKQPFLHAGAIDGVLLEVGRIQPAYFYTKRPCDREPPEMKSVATHVTIEQVMLPKEQRRKGILREFIQYLLVRVDAVQLRAVVNEEFRDYLLTKWVCQNVDVSYNPAFVLFK
jgi:hypothetical protein